MKIALDAMGGDHAPEQPVLGAVESLRFLSADDQIVLVGREAELRKHLSAFREVDERIMFVDAPEVIGMDEAPTVAFSRKRRASIPVGYQLLKQGEADAFVGAGNTGAMLVGAVYSLNTIQGIIRPCIPVMIPRSSCGNTLILDVGTNPDARPDVLYQYGLIGSIYARFMMGIENPRVALLNIGEEEEKGSLLAQAAYRAMKGTSDFNFIGNIESRDLFRDVTDVVVTDGFTGNVVVKQIEGFYDLLKDHGVTDSFFDRYNYENHGGTPILGVNGISMIAHGISSSSAISTMIQEAKKIFNTGLVRELQRSLKRFTE
ncbi:MAG: phosphate acyltransferase PlsX [Bacteroidales bacterium]